MNLIYIRTFLKIATTRIFERAARNLNFAQSTASARINTLEESLGHSLFNRSRAGLKSQLQECRFKIMH
jgi:DNA-binding transcriptional LysR family regulator